MIEKIPHRERHDFRYSINGDKLMSLGFQYEYPDLEEEVIETIEWYVRNEDWWRPLKNEK